MGQGVLSLLMWEIGDETQKGRTWVGDWENIPQSTNARESGDDVEELQCFVNCKMTNYALNWNIEKEYHI